DDIAHLVGYGEANTSSVEQLLVQFLHFIAVKLDLDKHCVCVREGNLKDADKSQFKHKHPPHMCIEDPFDPKDNVARSLTDRSVKTVKVEFLRAHEVMSRTGD
ncbi:hypothetical protein GUITHDRAFT_59080, partial [Guillardia theta CCMP2712]